MDCFLYTEECHRSQSDFIAKRLRFWSPCDQKRVKMFHVKQSSKNVDKIKRLKKKFSGLDK